MSDPTPAPEGRSADTQEAETAPPSAPAPPTGRLASAKKAWDFLSDIAEPRTIALVAAAIILGLVGLIGGWQEIEATEDTVPAAAAGQTIHAAPFDIAVLRANYGSQLKKIAYPESGIRYLFVVVRARLVDSKNPVAEPVNQFDVFVLSYAFTAVDPDSTVEVQPGVTISKSPSVYRLVDGEYGGTMQPGLDQELVLVFPQRATEPAPKRLAVTVREQTYRRSTLTSEWGWADPVAKAEVVVPITELAGEG